MKPILYYQLDEQGIPFDNFCSDAAIGAHYQGIKAVGVQSPPKYKQENIIVGTVEFTQEYLGREIPTIDHSWITKDLYKREVVETYIDHIEDYPCFIKPAQEIKKWTGIIVENKKEANLFTQNYKQTVFKSEIKQIESEYRVYVIRNRGIIGIKHYLGDPYIVPSREFVNQTYKTADKNLKENSYTLDFAIDNKGETFLIEVNDGWAIGNYGLPPEQYYSFIKNRFLQITGVLP